MYKDYYHLNAEPFGTHPNTGTFFISNTHKEAWYYLLFGIDTQEPFVVLTGEYGMGKTLLCLRLMKVLKEKGLPRVEYIPTSNEGYGGILRRMASNLGISPVPEDEEILQEMIYDRFRADTENTRFYLIIDDAHELDTAVLTKLKYLSTFNHNEFFPVIMIFVGHPSFLQDLRTPALNSLNQRIKRRYHLARFSLEDTKNYIYFRLMKSGATGIPAFPDETIRKIFEYSGGVPRLINNICDTCLLIGASKQLISIPPAVVDEAKNLVEGSLSTQEEPRQADESAACTTKEVTFSEDLPAGGAAVSQSAAPPMTETQEYQPEVARPKPSFFSTGMKRAITAAVVILLLLTLFSVLSRLFMDSEKMFGFFSSAPPPPTVQEAPPEQPGKEATTDVPTLREESTDKPSVPAPEARPEGTTTSGANEPSPKQAATPERQPPARVEAVPAKTGEPFPVYPFSLKSSSYQQRERALPEMAEIKQQGLTPYLVKSDLGEMGTLWRIYIGFYSTEEEARKAKTTYKLTNASIQKTDYACQVGEFSNDADGLSMFEKLRQAGYFPYAIQKGRNLFRLYLGAYEKKSEAETLNQELQKKGIASQVVKR